MGRAIAATHAHFAQFPGERLKPETRSGPSQFELSVPILEHLDELPENHCLAYKPREPFREFP
jgi:hypothetical protein